jgi:hypothetical protein
LLLRIVAAAGAGALIGACSSGSGTESGPCGTGVCGSIGLPVADAGDESVVGGGVMVRPDAASDQ